MYIKVIQQLDQLLCPLGVCGCRKGTMLTSNDRGFGSSRSRCCTDPEAMTGIP